MTHRHARRLSLVVTSLLVTLLAGCASIPRGRLGVSQLEIQGMEALDDESLEACLATQERPVFRLCFGSCKANTSCGVPPFDGGRVSLFRFSWPWTDWSLFDRSVFERDLERIRRWFRARGYYEAEITNVEITPEDALERRPPAARPSRDPSDEHGEGESEEEESEDCEGECEVEIVITVREGPPVLISSIDIDGIAELPVEVREEVWDQLKVERGGRFDEAFYDRSKDAIAKTLGDLGYAHALVRGDVELDLEARQAKVHFVVDSGPVCEFGAVTVEPIDLNTDCPFSDFEVPLDVIRETALLESEGLGTTQRFSSSRLAEAQRAIYELGAFSSVEVRAQIPEDRSISVIPVTIRAEPGKACRFGFGAGFLSGLSPQLGTTITNLESLPRWDIHLSASAEARNFLGGLRRFRIEERPRIIFDDQFPAPNNPAFGNLLRMEFRQPDFLEPRTTLVVQSDWDLGPDPFQGFFRHSVDVLFGPERLFLDGRLLVAARAGTIVQVAIDDTEEAETWETFFLEQFLRLDLRDRPTEPTQGFYFQLNMHQSGLVPVSSWNFFRFTPDVRGYIPLPFGIVLAARFGVGALFIVDSARGLNDENRDLGPNPLRLRGGGPTSNRGYLAGNLGDSENGGLRRWEASVELRVPITTNVIVVLFVDAGDVHSGLVSRSFPTRMTQENPRFRFDAPHISPGFGLRYRTPVGPIRLDVGWAPPGLRSFNDDNTIRRADQVNFLGLFNFPGAIHLTVGEAF